MILINGVPQACVDATDRGLAYGDGVFRTLLVRDGTAIAWSHHCAKLAQDCAALKLPQPDFSVLAAEVSAATQTGGEHAVKIIITRGKGPRGYAPPRTVETSRIVMSGPSPQYPAEFSSAGVRLRVCSLRLAAQPALAGIKHLNRLENVLARSEWDDPAVPEGLLLDAAGNVVSGTMSNVIILEGKHLVTPDLSQCGVAGVTRRRVMAAAQGEDVACREEEISLARLRAADAVVLVNSLIGVWPARELDGKVLGTQPLAQRVRKWLDEDDR